MNISGKLQKEMIIIVIYHDCPDGQLITKRNKLVEAIKEQGKQIDELHENLKVANKASIQKLDENKLETKQWFDCLKLTWTPSS